MTDAVGKLYRETLPTIPENGTPIADHQRTGDAWWSGDGVRPASCRLLDPTAAWCVLVVAGGSEDRVAAALWAMGQQAFVPHEYRYERVARHCKRRRRVRRVIFSGYCFAVVAAEAWDCVLGMRARVAHGGRKSQRLVRGPIGVDGRPSRVPAEVMANLIAGEGRDRPYVVAGEARARLDAGDHARVQGGPFAGTDVDVEAVDGDRVTAMLRWLGSDRRVTIPLGQFRLA